MHNPTVVNREPLIRTWTWRSVTAVEEFQTIFRFGLARLLGGRLRA